MIAYYEALHSGKKIAKKSDDDETANNAFKQRTNMAINEISGLISSNTQLVGAEDEDVIEQDLYTMQPIEEENQPIEVKTPRSPTSGDSNILRKLKETSMVESLAPSSPASGEFNQDSEMKRTVASSSNKRQTSSSLKSLAIVKNDYSPKSTKNIGISKEKRGGASKPHHNSINTSRPTIGDSRAGKAVVKQSKDKWIQQTSRRAFVDISNNSTSSVQIKSKSCSGPGSLRTRCTLVSSSSTLRSEERAEKRKEVSRS